jgi:type IV pilus assembly protein PilA
MLTIARKRLDTDGEDGFTLIELMVVVLIIAILLAIAIPTFLGAQDRARDRGAQSNLRNAITAAKTIATDQAGQFTGIDGAAMEIAEGSLTYVDGVTPAIGVVAVEVDGSAPDSSIILQTKSDSGAVFAICANSKGEVSYAKAAVADATGCTLPKW